MTIDRPSADLTRAMRLVLLALCPGILASVCFFGGGVLVNLAVAAFVCLGCEALTLRLLRLNIRAGLGDCSALITAALIALAMPPGAPLWLLTTACAVAVVLAKHACGGYHRNLFNPAMAGYACALLLYPAAFVQWPRGFDGVTGATALDVFRQNHGYLVANWRRMHAAFGDFGGAGWEWVNLVFLGGGMFLLQRKVIHWQAPIAAITALCLCALFFYDGGSSASGGSPLMHLFSGGTLLAIFFVVTEPVTLPHDKYAQVVFGALIGAMIFCIRHWGRYSDGIAFAVLLGNALVPLLDRAAAQYHTLQAQLAQRELRGDD